MTQESAIRSKTSDTRSVGGLADALLAGAARQARVPLGELLRLVGDRSFGAVLVLAAGANLSPAGMIPTVSTALAGVVAFTSLQVVAGVQHIWLPRFLRRKTVSRRFVDFTGRTMKRWSPWLDPWLTHGLRPLASRPFDRLAALICVLLSLTVPFLEFFPWVTNVPMTIVAIFGLGLLVRNGLLMGLGFASSLILAYFGYRLLAS